MDFKSYLNESAKRIDQEVEEILSDFLNEVKKTNSKLIPLALGFINSCKGGKRLRGTLVKLGYELVNSHSGLSRIDSGVAGAPQNDILRVGAALEILHAAILIHDDIIDQSQLRRGKLTLFRALGGDHYGISQALVLGDIGLYLPIKLIANSNFADSYKTAALAHLSQTIINTAWGEVLDLEIPHSGGTRQEEDVIAIHTLKTAYYTVSGPLVLGATLAGGDEQLIKILEEFGKNLGIAFQIQDDLLGVFGEEEEIGKSVTSDIEEGKNTLLITQALKKADKKQKDILDKYYGKDKIGMDELEKVRKVFRDTGALDHSRQTGVKYVNQAKKIISQITADKNMKRLLEEMADYLVERSK